MIRAYKLTKERSHPNRSKKTTVVFPIVCKICNRKFGESRPQVCRCCNGLGLGVAQNRGNDDND